MSTRVEALYEFEVEPLFFCPDLGDPITGKSTGKARACDMLKNELVRKYRLTHPAAELIAGEVGPDWQEFPDSLLRARMLRKTESEP